jgi:hypothetical protein
MMGMQAGGRGDSHEGNTLVGQLKYTSVVTEICDMLEMQAGGHRDSREGGITHVAAELSF